MMNVSLFLLLFLYIITIIPSKKHLTYTSSQITYLFNWHFRENPFHISYYTPSALICQLVFCIICFLFFKAI